MPENRGIHIDVKINFNGIAKAVVWIVGYKIVKEAIDYYKNKED